MPRLSRAMFGALPIDDYPQVDSSKFNEKDADLFKRRVKSIELYHRGESHKNIYEATKRSRQEVSNDINRFLSMDDMGNYLGWSGLIPGKKVGKKENYDSPRNIKRRKNVYFARGALTKLLDKYPSIKFKLDNLIRGKDADNKPIPKLVTPGDIHAGFIEMCKQAGLGPSDYPLVTDDKARRAIFNYRNRQLVADPIPVLKALYGESATRAFRTGSGRDQPIPASSRLYQRIEVDGHELPIVGAIQLPGFHRLRPIYKAMAEITLVFVVECGSSAILGYSIRWGKNYSSMDVLRAIRKALVKWEPLDLDSRLGIQYPEDGGLPGGLIPELEFALWRDLHWDNFRSHLSPFLLNQIPASCPVVSPRAAPNTHAVIESVNGVIDRMFKNEFIGTASGRGQAAARAEEIGFTCEIIEQIIDVAIATYNAEPPAWTNISRINLLRNFACDPRSLIARIPASRRPQFKMFDFEAVVQVSGSKRQTKNGKQLTRPYFRFHHGDYSAKILSTRFDLIGKKLLIRGVSDDLVYLECWLEDGTPFGTVKVLGGWAQHKHGFETRSIADKFRRNKSLDRSDNPVKSVIRILQKEAATSSRVASQLARVLQETGWHWGPEDQQAEMGYGPITRDDRQSAEDPFPELGVLY